MALTNLPKNQTTWTEIYDAFYLLLESGSYLLQENGDKLLLGDRAYKNSTTYTNMSKTSTTYTNLAKT